MTSKKIVGVMSGTSLDGIDVFYGLFSKNGFEKIFFETVDYTQGVDDTISKAIENELPVRGLCSLNVLLSKEYQKAIEFSFEKNNMKLGDVDLISIHGQTIYHLMGTLLYSSHYNQNFPFHLRYGTNTGREMLWIVTVYSQAIARNTNIPQTSNGFANAGPGTEMLYYETAAHALASTVSGANLWEMAPARNKNPNRGTPLEARLAAEVGYGATLNGITRSEANKIVNGLLEKYEQDIPEAPLGKTFQELYDLENDPDESRNLYGNQEYSERREEMLWQLTARLVKNVDPTPFILSQW
jgi:hypothetical protein